MRRSESFGLRTELWSTPVFLCALSSQNRVVRNTPVLSIALIFSPAILLSIPPDAFPHLAVLEPYFHASTQLLPPPLAKPTASHGAAARAGNHRRGKQRVDRKRTFLYRCPARLRRVPFLPRRAAGSDGRGGFVDSIALFLRSSLFRGIRVLAAVLVRAWTVSMTHGWERDEESSSLRFGWELGKGRLVVG